MHLDCALPGKGKCDRGTVGGVAGEICRANYSIASLKVSAMKWGLLPVSHNALLVGDMAYFDFNGEMEQEADRINLQKCLGPTCKVWFREDALGGPVKN